jgi:hypothetical protein
MSEIDRRDYEEHTIESLVGMGFGEDRVLKALFLNEGDEDQALIALVQGGDVTAEGDGDGEAATKKTDAEQDDGKSHAADLSSYNLKLDAVALRAKREHDVKHGLERLKFEVLLLEDPSGKLNEHVCIHMDDDCLSLMAGREKRFNKHGDEIRAEEDEAEALKLEWDCPACTTHNPPGKMICITCEGSNSTVEAVKNESPTPIIVRPWSKVIGFKATHTANEDEYDEVSFTLVPGGKFRFECEDDVVGMEEAAFERMEILHQRTRNTRSTLAMQGYVQRRAGLNPHQHEADLYGVRDHLGHEVLPYHGNGAKESDDHYDHEIAAHIALAAQMLPLRTDAALHASDHIHSHAEAQARLDVELDNGEAGSTSVLTPYAGGLLGSVKKKAKQVHMALHEHHDIEPDHDGHEHDEHALDNSEDKRRRTAAQQRVDVSVREHDTKLPDHMAQEVKQKMGRHKRLPPTAEMLMVPAGRESGIRIYKSKPPFFDRDPSTLNDRQRKEVMESRNPQKYLLEIKWKEVR